MSALLLLASIALEFPMVLLAYSKHRILNVLLVCFLINGVTHPIATYAYQSGTDWFLVEIGVVLTETILILLTLKGTFIRAFLAALLANAISAAVGLAIS